MTARALKIATPPAPAFIVFYGLSVLLIIGTTGIFDLLKQDPTSILELIFLLSVSTSVLTGMRGKNIYPAILLTSIIYLIYSFLSSYLGQKNNILDFLVAYKSIYYIGALSFVAGKQYFTASTVTKLFKLALVCFGIRYAFEFFILGDDRPTLLIENNFELIFLLLLFYSVYIFNQKLNITQTIAMVIIFGLSGSRSSVVALFVVLLFMLGKETGTRKLIAYGLFITGGAMAAVVFALRSVDASLESIDRYRFFLEFLYSTQNWSLWKFLVGSTALTPMSPDTCAALFYYQKLFSFNGDGVCYSVVLHSFFLRAVYDHGLIGLVLLLLAVWLLLKQRSFGQKLCILGVISATALSVSSLNNVYVALSLLVISSLKLSPSHTPNTLKKPPNKLGKFRPNSDPSYQS